VNVVTDGRQASDSGGSNKFVSIPPTDEWSLSNVDAPSTTPAFLYYCDNETVDGVEFGSAGFPVGQLPEAYREKVPLVADMSSNILSRRIPPELWNHLGVVFAGAQKNLAPSGLTLVIVRKHLIQAQLDLAVPFGGFIVPDMLSYKTLAAHHSLYNTPPMFSIYVCNLVLKDLSQNKGGVETIEKINQEKSRLVYDLIDNSHGFFVNSVSRNVRSRINIVFNCPLGPELEELFIREADQAHGIKQIKGHRCVPLSLPLYT
jgi:phosphoserine aminotransferase